LWYFFSANRNVGRGNKPLPTLYMDGGERGRKGITPLAPPAKDKESKGRKGIRPFDYNSSFTSNATPSSFHA